MTFPPQVIGQGIGRRLALGFTAVIGLTVVVGVVALTQMREIAGHEDLLFRHPFTVTRAVDHLDIQIIKIHREMKDLANARSAHVEQHAREVQLYEDEAFRQLGIVRESFLGDPAEVEGLHDALIGWRPYRSEVMKLRSEGDFAAADAITRGEGADHVAFLEERMAGLRGVAADKAAQAIASTEAVLRRALLTTSLLLGIAAVLGTIIAVWITSSIRTPVSSLALAADRVAEGDLEQQVAVLSDDELGRLSRQFNAMVDSIRSQTDEIHRKNEENEALLLNILPAPIASRLKRGEERIADYLPNVTVLFADLAGFTSMSRQLPPATMVSMLDDLFSAFDDCAQRLGIEKIKTMGDGYMAVAGLVKPLDDEAAAMVEMALDMLRAVRGFNEERELALQLRIGINSGPVVAGVIGRSKFIYDLWGDTVNLASRMESHGIDGRIQVTEAIHESVGGRFFMEARGEIELKGRGMVHTYLVVDRNA